MPSVTGAPPKLSKVRNMYTRYAIYYTPASVLPLAQFGAAWLGWDSAAGRAVEHLNAPDVDVARVTQTPRKYGFHGTIKPPFRLLNGLDAEMLETALFEFCANRAQVVLPSLKVQRLGGFLALVPNGSAMELGHLASDLVRDLDYFRAPPRPEELSKRRSQSLSSTQEANLERWGYPYVMDDFRFHMTLTGRLPKDDMTKVETAVSEALKDINVSPFVIEDLTLLGEDQDGRFHQLARAPLGN